MKNKLLFMVTMAGIICLNAVTARAQQEKTCFIGVNAGWFDSVFIDHFTRWENSTLDEKNTFEDKYKAQLYGGFFGYRLINKARTFVNLQVHANYYNREFRVETSKSILIRKLEYSFGIDLQPGFNISDTLSTYINLSLDRGKFKYTKSGTSTTYDSQPSVIGYGLGVGFEYRVISSLSLKLQYQYCQYGMSEISTTLTNSVKKIDFIQLIPKYDIVTVSLQYNFKAFM